MCVCVCLPVSCPSLPTKGVTGITGGGGTFLFQACDLDWLTPPEPRHQITALHWYHWWDLLPSSCIPIWDTTPSSLSLHPHEQWSHPCCQRGMCGGSLSPAHTLHSLPHPSRRQVTESLFSTSNGAMSQPYLPKYMHLKIKIHCPMFL